MCKTTFLEAKTALTSELALAELKALLFTDTLIQFVCSLLAVICELNVSPV
jgi:hypothetical protein